MRWIVAHFHWYLSRLLHACSKVRSVVDTLNNKNAKIISQVAQYIYDHSDQTITLDGLAKYTGFSKYHFNRLFFAATGFQLGEYIQRLKLDKALQLIKKGNHNILDVALCVGYDSPSSFSRAFKKHYTVTPREVIQGKLPVNERAGSLKPKKVLNKQKVSPTWHTLPAQTLFGLHGKGFCDQSFSAMAGRLYAQLTKMAEPLSYESLQPVGISLDNPWSGEQAESQFFAAFVNGLDAKHHMLGSYLWQGGTWASFTHVGPHDCMWQTISLVYSQWVLPNNIKLKDQQIVQLYLNNPLVTAPEELKTDLYFAVETHE